MRLGVVVTPISLLPGGAGRAAGGGGCRSSNWMANVTGSSCTFSRWSRKWRGDFGHLSGKSRNGTVVQVRVQGQGRAGAGPPGRRPFSAR